jgi:cellulose synthase/poly-beta-1,6-N-acetylglucosamine synthase-like glycosyltransferase
MFFSYTMSVILLSLSMYGIWWFLHDIWQWWLEPRWRQRPSCSFLVVVRKFDGEIEDLFRYLARKIAYAEIDADIVVVDVSSDDLIAAILERLAREIEIITVMVAPTSSRAIGDAMVLCRGKVVHVLDLSQRMDAHDFMTTVCTLLSQDHDELLFRRVAK